LIRIGDLVEVPEIKTVIQLKDLEREDLRRMILDSFVVTAEVAKALELVLKSLAGTEGRGSFLKGNFGSGKSHFLGILSLLLRHPEAWPSLIQQEPSLESLRRPMEAKKFLVVEVSLIQHRGTEFLEDIFLKEIFRELSLRMGRSFEGKESRRETFEEIRQAMARLGAPGLVLLVDELSEFLRSKSDAHAYREDIRFLQYLGEEASSFPLWIVASLQEWIEETGEISQDTFNKIKDRYPVRLTLGRAHIEELVSHRLIRHRPGAQEEIRKVFQALRVYFPSFPVDEKRFMKLYPVHPATITLLDRLKPLFSEHRGIVDFIHYRLKGDGERGIPTFLDRPAQELLGPAAIFDHFLHRIREMAETQPYVEKGFEYFREEIPQIFKDPDQERVALEAVKLLILFAISPVEARFTARHMAEMVLFRVTELDGQTNYQYFRDILSRLVKETSFLAVSPGKDPLDDRISIDLRVDLSAVLRRKIRQGVAEIFPGDRRLFHRLLPLAESSHIPFAGWAELGRQKVSTLWEYTRRSGLLLLRQIDEIPLSEMEELAGEWTQVEEDFFLVVGTAFGVDRQHEHLRRNLLPSLKEKSPGTFFFWVPAAVGEEEEVEMRELLAVLLLLEKQREDSAEGGPGAAEYLQNLLRGGKKRLGEILTRAYFSGRLLWDDRQVELSAYGFLTQERFLQEFVPPLLSRRFPKHHRVHPYLEAFSPTSMPSLIRDFFATGSAEIDDRSKFGLRAMLDSLLKPMGLVKVKGNHYSLQVDPRTNELAAHFFSLLDKGVQSPEALYWAFRKGDYGLLRYPFEALVLALIFSGNVVPYQGQRKKGLEDVSRGGLQGITTLGKGEILSMEARQVIPGHPLIPEKFRKGTFTLPSQEALWGEVKARKEAEAESLRNLLNRIGWASSFQALKNLPWDSYRREVEDVLAQWEEVKVSFPAREGLERFLAAASREPFLSDKIRRVEEMRNFFDHTERLLFVHQYAGDPRLSIPDRPEVAGLRKDQEEILRFFEKGRISIDAEKTGELMKRFQDFREKYIQSYAEAHRRAKSADRFAPYQKVRQSRRYQVLARLDQLEMISVPHNRSSVDRELTAALKAECDGPSPESLQSNPRCSCGYGLGEEVSFPPVREMEESIDRGIRETLEALASAPYQERFIPYLSGLDAVGENEKASAIRRVLAITPAREDILPRLEEALTPQALREVNEAFRGRVVIVKRDLDQIYGALIQRKYTLAQVRKILREWLKEEEVSDTTFVHFIGQGETGGKTASQDAFFQFFQADFPHLLSLVQEAGPRVFKKTLLLSLWVEGHAIPSEEMIPLFPFLGKEKTEKGDLLIRELSRAARSLQRKMPSLLEGLLQEMEGEEGVAPEAWKLLQGRPAQEIFRREALLPSILRQALEKLLASPEEREGEVFSHLENSLTPLRTPDFIRRQAEMAEVLQDLSVLRQKVQALKRRENSPPQDFAKWESLYTQQLSPLAHVLGTVGQKVQRMDVALPPGLKERLAQAETLCGSISRSFAEYYRGALPRWEAGEEKRPVMVEDLPGLNPWKRKTSEGRERILILLDGMRWDLWEYMKEAFFKPMSHQLRIVSEGALWAHFPTSTPRQLEFLREATEKALPGGKGREENLWKLGGMDERVHMERGGLEYLFRNILQSLQLDLAPRLRELPPQTLLLFFSDHGFVENPLFDKSDKYRTSRYSHGEPSPFEVIVPWAAAIRI
jgi:hypothetical protein